MSASKAGNVKVVCRVRPQNKIELSHGGTVCVSMTESEISVQDEGKSEFTFDRIFGPESTQVECFEYVALPIVTDVLEGYNATIFAYGQTSSGKTYTMEGASITDPVSRGIIPRTVCSLFDGVLQADSNIEFTVKVSYVEIYMERIRDLLDQFRTKVNLAIREDPRQGIYVAGVTEEYCTCEDELLQLMQNGAQNREVAATGMNEGSSRSHSVFMVTLTQRHVDTGSSKTGKLFLVDLAGSEMVRKTNASGQQLEEAKTINKSLSALGLVINALTDSKATHVPYRDSKLTRMLQDSLGGNSKTCLVINVSPSSYNASETLSTLRFGSRAKAIQNKPRVNEQRSVEELSQLLAKAENAIDMQQSYIMALEGQLRSGQAEGSIPAEGAGVANEDEIIALQAKIANLREELSEEQEESKRRGVEVEKLTGMLKEKEQLLVQAGDLMEHAERECAKLQGQVESLNADKSKATDELADMQEQMREVQQKSEFDDQELRLRLEKLEQENQRLKDDIDESNRLGAQAGAGVSAGASPVTSGLEAEEQPEEGDKAPAQPELPRAPVQAQPPRAPERDIAYSPEQIEQLSTKLGLSDRATEFLRARESEWAQEIEAARAEGARDDATAIQLDFDKHIKEITSQRAKLAADLERCCEQKLELEKQLDQVKASDPQAAEVFAERERNHMRSLQQRLEQLVAVHRQLLRKYAALELDNGESKKKITLRDERIRQLEANTKTLAHNMRQQAERHVTELTKLREQMSSVREEQQMTMMSRIEANNEMQHGSGPRALRGGAGGGGDQVRAIRGGGSRASARGGGTGSGTDGSFLGSLFSRSRNTTQG